MRLRRARWSTPSTAWRPISERVSRKCNGCSSSPMSAERGDDFRLEGLDAASIRAAAARIEPWVRRTPVMEADGADFGLAGLRLVFKLEFLQHAGSFKTRGAFNSLLSRTIPAAGVAAASGGNHGAA